MTIENNYIFIIYIDMFKKKTASFIIFVIIDNTNLAYVYFYHCLNVNK